MGKVMTKVKLTNATDIELARQGLIPPDAVRTIEVDALVDTGATMLALPADLVARLGVPEIEKRQLRLADGSIIPSSKVGDLRIEILGRQMTGDALVLPPGVTPLIGQIQLEEMDLVVDPASREARPNPAHPDGPILDLLCAA